MGTIRLVTTTHLVIVLNLRPRPKYSYKIRDRMGETAGREQHYTKHSDLHAGCADRSVKLVGEWRLALSFQFLACAVFTSKTIRPGLDSMFSFKPQQMLPSVVFTLSGRDRWSDFAQIKQPSYNTTRPLCLSMS